LSTWIGGRAVHATMPKVGGFVKLPDLAQQDQTIRELKKVRSQIFNVMEILAKDEFNFSRETNFIGFVNEDFNFNEGKIASTTGWSIEEQDFDKHLERVVIPYSMASGYKIDGNGYMVGALARINLNKINLHAATKKDCAKYLELFPSNDIFLNNLAQTIEIIYSIDDSIEILENLKIKPEEPIPVKSKKSTGVGVLEAPRGLLFYKLNIDDKGTVKNGQIVVPTQQNQINIETDIKKLVQENLDKPKKELINMMERLIRAYDPCMSCAAHFLRVKWID